LVQQFQIEENFQEFFLMVMECPDFVRTFDFLMVKKRVNTIWKLAN